MNTLTEKQADKKRALENEIRIENEFTELCGITPSVISAYKNPFVTLSPKTIEDYFTILNSLKPTEDLFEVTFAGKDSIKTFSPYSISYGGKHESPNYMEVSVKFKHSICPVWVKMPDELVRSKFTVSTIQGEHIAFGRYKEYFTHKANGGTKVQIYYGESKTMYAADPEQAEQLKEFIFSL